MRRLRTIHAAAAVLLLCTFARAQQTRFPAGMTEFSLSGGYTIPIRFSEAGITSVSGTIGKFFWNNNSISLDLGGHFAEQPNDHDDVWIVSAGVLGRWHFSRFDRWSIFLDGGGGVAYGDDQFPAERYEGTYFNFYGKVGLGASYQLRDREFLMGGVRYYHLSNGQMHGEDQNPGYDGLQCWVGLMWTR